MKKIRSIQLLMTAYDEYSINKKRRAIVAVAMAVVMFALIKISAALFIIIFVASSAGLMITDRRAKLTNAFTATTFGFFIGLAIIDVLFR